MHIAKWPGIITGLALTAMLVTAADSPAYADKKKKNTITGAVVGAGVGALVGNSTTAVVGAVLGGIVGSEIKK
ncbi:MAG: YMGG-like glycine zipper-containing protein [Paracoccaceae bacterium]